MANHNQRPETLTDLSTTGQPLVLLYAFAASGGPWSPPVTFVPENGQVWLELPADELRAPVRLEYSATLKDGEWMPLTRANNASSVFTTGESGPMMMNLPSGEKGFIRLSLAD